jgi:hypothetical protein
MISEKRAVSFSFGLEMGTGSECTREVPVPISRPNE